MSETRPIFVSFFTPDYKRQAAKLADDCGRFHLPWHIEKRPRRPGGKITQTNQKPAFIAEMLKQYAGRPVVWIDADARIRHRPTLFIDNPHELLLLRWLEARRYKLITFSGTLYFANGQRSRDLVEAWKKESRQRPADPDDRNLMRAMAGPAAKGLDFELLPVEYCFVRWLHGPLYPGIDPVIDHG